MRSIARKIFHAIPSHSLRATALRIVNIPYRGKVVCHDLGGYRAELHLEEIMEFSAYLGSFERSLAERIDALTRPGMTVLDIGANVGLHALRFAHRVGSNGQVYAFEPTDFAYRKLVRNATLNPSLNLKPLQLALSNQPATNVEIDFRASWRFDGSRADGNTSIIDFERLDDWVLKQKIERIDLIKIDIDGFEGLAIDGGRSSIERFRPAMFMEASVDQYGKGRPDAFAILADLGYRFEMLANGEAVTAASIPTKLAELSKIGAESFNLYARPE